MKETPFDIDANMYDDKEVHYKPNYNICYFTPFLFDKAKHSSKYKISKKKNSLKISWWSCISSSRMKGWQSIDNVSVETQKFKINIFKISKGQKVFLMKNILQSFYMSISTALLRISSHFCCTFLLSCKSVLTAS